MKTVEVRVVHWSEIAEQQIAAWDALELRSLDQNIYLSPHFVLPALRYLESSDKVLVVLIERKKSAETELIGLGLFEPVAATRRFPLPHLRALQTRHSYETGLLLDPEQAETAIDAFIRWCSSDAFTWHGVEFPLWPSGGGGDMFLQKICKSRHVQCEELDRNNRATLNPTVAGEDYIQKQLSANRLKDLRRKQRRLADLGKVSWKAHSGNDVTEEVVQRFLDLEHAGWKGEHGCSLKSSIGNEQFFRCMVLELSKRGRAVFTEISIDDNVISSTSNFLSGQTGFAFKLGWNPDYAKYSPGIMNEVEIVRNAPQLFSSMTCLDSGASEGSFMDQLWAGRRSLTHIVIPTSLSGRFILCTIGWARKIKRQFFDKRRPSASR
jgi:CelD/BcsL family acetyltransferase involved in cellulose biosynthesis